MTATTEIQENKYSILLKEKGFKKLETFLKIANQRAEEFFIEINPEENSIKVSCLDQAHISMCSAILNNDDFDDDFEIKNLNSILQFNLKSQDLTKILTFNIDNEIMIVPDIDKDNNFDLLKFVISQNDVVIKEIYVPISEATDEKTYENSQDIIKKLLEDNKTIALKLNTNYFIEILKESEIFNNERIKFHIEINDKSIEKIHIETYNKLTDKTRRIKTNLFEGLHFQHTQLKNTSNGNFEFDILVSYSDLKKLAVTSKIYHSMFLLLDSDKPLGIVYSHDDNITFVDSKSLVTVLAPILGNDSPIDER